MKLYCSECGKEYESGKFCPECGVKLQECSAMLQELTPEMVCPNCGVKVESGKFCHECGSRLNDSPEIAFFEINTPKDGESYWQEGKVLYDKAKDEGDYKKAFSLFTKAAELGNFEAMNKIGLMYCHGKGVQQNYKEAFEWFSKAAEQGYAIAQCNLGSMYEKGDGVQKNLYEAVNWYHKSADQGNAIAQCNLGVLYEKGSGVPKDWLEAEILYLKAAEQWMISTAHNANPELCIDWVLVNRKASNKVNQMLINGTVQKLIKVMPTRIRELT